MIRRLIRWLRPQCKSRSPGGKMRCQGKRWHRGYHFGFYIDSDNFKTMDGWKYGA